MRDRVWIGMVLVAMGLATGVGAAKKKPAAKPEVTPEVPAASQPAAQAGTTQAAPATGKAELPEKVTAATPVSGALAQGLADAGRHEDAIRVINRLIQMDPVAARYDRQAQLMLRAECHLRLKQSKDAIDTLEAVRLQAIKAADKSLEVRATALQFLVQHSPGLHYVPSTGESKLPIDIVEAKARDAAYDAIFSDQLALLHRKVSDSKGSESISGILEVAKVAHEVRCLNMVASGNTKKTKESLKGLPGVAAERIKTALEEAEKTIGQISMNANTRVRKQTGYHSENGGMAPTYVEVKTGLSTGDVATLKNIESTCDRIPGAVEDLVEALGHADAYSNRRFKALPRAAEVKRRATEVLRADYSR